MVTVEIGQKAVITRLAESWSAWRTKARQRSTRRRAATAAILRLALRLVLTLAGLGLVVAAAWTVALGLGLLAAGMSCFVLEWVVKSDTGGGR